jgi:hypothetical protein
MQRIILGVACLLLTVGGDGTFTTHAQQTAKPALTAVGGARVGDLAMEMVGQIDQNDVAFSGYGYLTNIQSLANKSLFSNGDVITHTEANAHFTVILTATTKVRTPISKTDVATIHSLDVVGTATYFYNASPSASFSDPASFRRGKRIATFGLHLHDALNVLSPNHGIITADGRMVQRTAPSFTVGGHQYRIGRVGQISRFSANGGAMRIDVPRSVTIFAGDVSVTRNP